MNWEVLLAYPQFALRRAGRYLIADLLVPCRVLSTSVRNGGQTEHLRHLANHQSCEGADHLERCQVITARGLEAYHDTVCNEVAVSAEETAVMGTAANMNYAAVKTESDDDVTVVAVVTAGVQGNAASAGDPALWREKVDGWEKVPVYAGTINTLVLINVPLTEGALARAAITMAEAKSAALQRLGIRSLYSNDLATGTGTDQYCIAAPLKGEKPLTSTSPHVKLGELIGRAVRDATLEALRWQNGLEPSYTRGMFHALKGHGLKEDCFYEEIAPLMSERGLVLLKKNNKSIFYEPHVAAAAYAIAAVMDRVRYGTLPESVASEAMRQQAALLASNLAAQPDRWNEFRDRLQKQSQTSDCKMLILAAIALGWTEKWRSD
ncbi:MAG: adenosylcobinamide amidohydrolase [Candidatus Korobacteraceae bacterium]